MRPSARLQPSLVTENSCAQLPLTIGGVKVIPANANSTSMYASIERPFVYFWDNLVQSANTR